jgi:hypothetical protein
MTDSQSQNPFAKKAEPQPIAAPSSTAAHLSRTFNVNDALEDLDHIELDDLPKPETKPQPAGNDPQVPTEFNIGFFKPKPDPRRSYFIGVIVFLFIAVVILVSLLGVCVHDKNHRPNPQNITTVTATATSFITSTTTQPPNTETTNTVTVTVTQLCSVSIPTKIVTAIVATVTVP